MSQDIYYVLFFADQLSHSCCGTVSAEVLSVYSSCHAFAFLFSLDPDSVSIVKAPALYLVFHIPLGVPEWF